MDETNRNKWDNYYAKAEESNVPPPWVSSEPLAALVEFMASHKIKNPAGKCVEFGSGSSCSSIYLAEQGYSVDAVDICPLAIERAKRFNNAHLVHWKEADLLAEDLFDAHLKGGDYDLVFDMQCFHVLRLIDEKKAAANIYRALKPGGTAVVVVGALLPDNTSDTTSSTSTADKAKLNTSTTPAAHDNSTPRPGPPLLSLDELRLPLEAAGLTTVQLSLSRFNSTRNYASLPGGLAPLAWVGVFQKVLWSSELLTYALEVQAPFSTYILQGRKTIETRAYPLPRELLGVPMYLLESAQGRDGVSSVGDFIPARMATVPATVEGGNATTNTTDETNTTTDFLDQKAARNNRMAEFLAGLANTTTTNTNTAATTTTATADEINTAADLLVQKASKKGKISRFLANKTATAMRMEVLGQPSDDIVKAFGGGGGGGGGNSGTTDGVSGAVGGAVGGAATSATTATTLSAPTTIAPASTNITATTTTTTPRIIGTVVFTSSTPFTSQADWERDRALHMVPLHSTYDYCDTTTGVQRLHTHHAHLQTQASIGLKEGKINELYAWNVGFVEVGEKEEFPALERVYRSIFKVVK